jgi:hypothetical protein
MKEKIRDWVWGRLILPVVIRIAWGKPKHGGHTSI